MDYIDKHKDYVAKEATFLSAIRGFDEEKDHGKLTNLQLQLDQMRAARTQKATDDNREFYQQARQTVGRAILKKRLPEPERKGSRGLILLSEANIY